MGQLSIIKKQEGPVLYLEISGQIDEDVDFSSQALTGVQEIVLDLASVKTINSCGIREWIDWIKTAESAQKITYKNCPKVIVDQINMVEGFLPVNGKVESFFVPYYSEDSGEEKNILFRHGIEFTDHEITPPSGVQDSEGHEMEMDIIEGKYFKFLAR